MDKRERIGIVNKIIGVVDKNCEGCKNHKLPKKEFDCDTQCKVGKELFSLRKQLDGGGNNVPVETKEKKPKLSLAMYQDLQAKGLKDKEIAKQFNFTPTYVSQLKKKWGIRPPLEKPKETPVKSDRIGEIEQIVSEKDYLIGTLKAQIKVLEDTKNERINFLESEIERYSQVNTDLQSESGRYYDRIMFLDQQHENDKKALEGAYETFARYEKENTHLWGLLSIYMPEGI